MFLSAHGFDLVLGMEWVGVMERVATGELSRAELSGLFVVAMGADVPIDGEAPRDRQLMARHRGVTVVPTVAGAPPI
jgi:hypothetical protein